MKATINCGLPVIFYVTHKRPAYQKKLLLSTCNAEKAFGGETKSIGLPKIVINQRFLKYLFVLFLFCFCSISFPSVSWAEAYDYDVVVAGGGAGGIMAAIEAVRGGAKVAVIEPSSWIGGQMTAAGVSTMDDLSRQKSGLYLDFITRVNKYYDNKGKSTGTCYWDSRSVAFEPNVGEKILYEMVDEARNPDAKTRKLLSKSRASENERVLDIFLDSSIIEVQRIGRKITGVKAKVSQKNSRRNTFKNEIQVACKVLIDATEYGDIIPLANLPYRAGNSHSPFIKLDESMIQDITWTAVIKYYPSGAPPDLTPYAPLPGYEEAKRNYESYVTIDGKDFRGVFPVELPVNLISHNAYRAIPDSSTYYSYDGNRQNWRYISKTGVNWGNDYPGKSGWNSGSSGLPARYLEDISFRNRINKEAFFRTLNFIYYMQNELGDLGRHWSVADDEYYNDNIPPDILNDIPASWHEIAKRMPVIPYVRESRRIIGERTLSSREILINSLSYRDGETNAEFPNAIAIGGYPLDLHHAANDGDFEWEFGESRNSIASNRPRGAFQVPLDILIPKDADGFLAVEKNLSMSRLAAGAIRLQPISMMVGQAAGALAALAVKLEIGLREVPAVKVQSQLVKHGVHISLCKYSDVPPESPFFGVVQISNLYGLFEPKDYPHAPSYNILNLDDPKLAMAILRGADKGVFGVDEMISNEDVEYSVKKALSALNRNINSIKPINNPKRLASKADFVRYIAESFGFSDLETESGVQFFQDVPPEHKAFDAVNVLLNSGVINSVKGAKYNPAQPITRGEAAVIIVRAMDFTSAKILKQ
ncbi:MAG: FAD-dependent oxidoreductase [Synergistaceae bacterium]|nr:FAD-dependent oxidoreductase [Synergistaceae bacterium]